MNAYGLRLRSVPFFSAVKEYCIERPYNRQCARSDLLAGITVALTGIPLAMALALAAGLPPQFGLYGALISGVIAALIGGSALTITAPTTAFVVVIYPVMQQYGLSGVLTTGLLTGIILLAMGAARLGRLISYMPEAVTMGFSVGIAIVIISLQLKDFLGIPLANQPIGFIERLNILARNAADSQWQEASIGIVTLSVFLLFRQNRWHIPHALIALTAGLVLSLVFYFFNVPVERVGERFHYINANHNLAALLPTFVWPWKASIVDGSTQWLNINGLGDISSAAFALAMLAAMEAMLTSLVLKDMTWKRSYPNGELLGMGLSNMVGAFFSAMPVSAALSRSVANATAGGKTPVASIINAVTVLLVLVFLARFLALFPVAMLAGLLIGVAWTLGAIPKVIDRLNKALWSDQLVFFTGLLLTVFYNMVAAITVGVLLSCVLFVKEIANSTRFSNITNDKAYLPNGIASGWAVYRICGPLFFAAADRVFADLEDETADSKGVLISMDAVNMIDAGGLVAMERFIAVLTKRRQHLIIADVQYQPLRMFAKAKMRPRVNVRFAASLAEGLNETTYWDHLSQELVMQKEFAFTQPEQSARK